MVEQRHGDNLRGHKEHPIQPVFFDDWTPIVDVVPNARAMVLEATTLYASVDVLLYFILHSDTAHAWGVDRKGAALKDNFVKLTIIPQYDENGMVIRSQTQGAIRFAGESVDRPARLFNGPPLSRGKPVVIEPRALPTAKPSPKEVAMIELAAAGHSYNEIARRVFGHTGGKQVKTIKQTIQRFK